MAKAKIRINKDLIVVIPLTGQKILPLFIENPCNACLIPTEDPKRYFSGTDENQEREACR
jgi:hypothetical protein